MKRGDIVTLVTDPRETTGIVVGTFSDGRIVVAWHIGRTWAHDPATLKRV